MNNSRKRCKIFFRGKWISHSWHSRLLNRRSLLDSESSSSSSSSSECEEFDAEINNPEVDLHSEDHSTQLRNPSFSESDVEVTFNEMEVHQEEKLRKFRKSDLVSWAIACAIPVQHCTALLKILKQSNHIDTTDLPKDGRTLLRTPRNVQLEEMGNGYFIYTGIRQNILHYPKFISENFHNTIRISVNIDGLNVFKSSGNTLWPILCKMSGSNRNIIFPVALYLGRSKPDEIKKFLSRFVTECCELCNHGLMIGKKHFKFRVDNIILDAPAKSFVYNIKGHNGYGSCLRCTVVGSSKKGRTSFHLEENAMRKLKIRDANIFRKCEYSSLQNGSTPITKIPHFDIILDCPYDYLHLTCLGIMRTMLKLWISSKRCHRGKMYSLSYLQCSKLSAELLRISAFCPSEFSRKCRGLSDLPYFKGTEFRQIMLYVGVIAFRGIVEENFYKHFLLLNVIMRFLVEPGSNFHRMPVIEKFVRKFVHLYSIIYGKHLISHNVHALLHLCDDVLRFGPVDQFSAFPFKSFLFKIKKSVRSGFGALQQIVKRQIERNLVQEDLMTAPQYPQLLRQQNMDRLFPNSIRREDFQSFKFCKFSSFSIDTQHSANNVVFHRDGSIFRVLNFVRKIHTSDEYFIGKRYTSVCSFYNYPVSSKHCYIYEVSGLADVLEMHEISSIAYKGFAVPVKSGTSIVVSRILHTE